MTQRITAQMIGNSTVTTIDNDLNQLDNTEEELSTGYQINEPSDNPYGAALTLSLNGQISAYSSYQTNISESTASVETASSSLQSIQQVVATVRELTVEGANGTMSATDLQDAAAEVLQSIGQVKESADAQYDGSYVFSGDAVSTQPWDTSATAADPATEDQYGGNQNTINTAIGPSTQLQVNANLYSVLGNGNTGGTAATSSSGGGAVQTDGSGGMLATMRMIYNDMTGTNGGTQSDLSNQLTNLDTNISSLESVQATVGATQDRLEMAGSRLTALTTTDSTELGNVQDTDMAQATVQFSTEQAGYQAALQSTADIIQTSLMNFLTT
ncbi:MAG TPA: flagellin [Solirubrobacteraceae bacterium]|jgi:flagellar hook-associated protein 3 FlgL|nr:flagellin [Solirubrobacteraceae bacterium]